jgi:asparagine synthetase B (glutamine-hydrolysing)
MCSFLFCRTDAFLETALVEKANQVARKRGPDFTGMTRLVDKEGRNLIFLHNLLDISGKQIRQPARTEERNGNVLLFNGEIYNYDRLRHVSDTEHLLECIGSTKKCIHAMKLLDGEYAILVYDYEFSSAVALTDCFMTKPLYFASSSKDKSSFAVASYSSTLALLGFDRIEMAQPNSAYSIRFTGEGHSLCHQRSIFEFDLEQKNGDFDGWIRAFVRAVYKRATHGSHRPFVCLSSGYDSGAICLALNLLGIAYETFSLEAGEATDVLQQRIKMNQAATCTRAHVWNGLSGWKARRTARDLARNVEFFSYVHEDAPGFRNDIRRDEAALGLNFIAMHAASAGLKVCLSGAGADEICSDYGILGRKIYHHSEFGGLFPEDLSKIFPWRKFYGDTQRSYLMKEEMVLGRHGIEGRYPFLDRAVVQEFLLLDVGLKNSDYKAPLAYFLRKHGYPFEAGAKRGFISRSDPWYRQVRQKVQVRP